MALFLMSLRVGGWVVVGWAPPARERAVCEAFDVRECVLKKCCLLTNKVLSRLLFKKSQKIFCLDILGFRRSWKKKGEKKDKEEEEEEEEDMSQKKHFELSKEKRRRRRRRRREGQKRNDRRVQFSSQ